MNAHNLFQLSCLGPKGPFLGWGSAHFCQCGSHYGLQRLGQVPSTPGRVCFIATAELQSCVKVHRVSVFCSPQGGGGGMTLHSAHMPCPSHKIFPKTLLLCPVSLQPKQHLSCFLLELLQAYRKVKIIVPKHRYTPHPNLSIINRLPHCFILLSFSTKFFFWPFERHLWTSGQRTSAGYSWE